MRNAAFLVDSGPGVGLGHLRRSGILLDAMTEAGFSCRLYCQDVDAAAALGRAASVPPAAIEELSAADVVICDSYLMHMERLARLRGRGMVLLVFDDMGDRPIDADFVLNHNLYGGTIDYSGLTHARVLSGPECTLVDPELLKARATHGANAGHGVVISFGGTDDGSRAAALARLLLSSFAGPYHIVVAPGITPSPDATALAAELPSAVILQQGPDMPRLLASARLYLGGAGMTALEALVVGLDMVLCVISENQRLNAEAFGRCGHAVVQGFKPNEVATIAASLLQRPFRPHPNPVDGKGASRVVSAVERLLGKQLA
jgi:spore coat polysaccharide biosynthesis predicted glycosyltransferase SpsG